MKALLAGVLLVVLLSLGCAPARLIPVKGPLSTQTPPPIYAAKLTVKYSSAMLSGTLGDGDVFKAKMEKATISFDPSGTPTTPVGNLSAEWDTVYGVGFFRQRAAQAQRYLRGEAKSTRGTLLTVEMIWNETQPWLGSKDSAPDLEVKGVAKDDKGNVYKLTFK